MLKQSLLLTEAAVVLVAASLVAEMVITMIRMDSILNVLTPLIMRQDGDKAADIFHGIILRRLFIETPFCYIIKKIYLRINHE